MTASRRGRSHELFERAKELIPGGVNSPVRAFRGVGGEPVFFARGKGPYLYDVDGNEYVDYVGSWGPLILGHAHPEILDAIARAAADGTSFGAPTEREVDFAEALCRAVPSMEMVRLVSSGTEATMAALRLARGFTRRDKIVKIDGGYHGARRHAARRRRLGRRHARHPRLGRRHARHRRRHAHRAVERRGGDARHLRRQPGRDRRGHRRAGLRQHGLRPAAPRLPGVPARADARRRRRCSSSTRS